MNCIHKAFQATEKITKTSRYRLALLKKKLRFHSLVACFSIAKGCPVTAFNQYQIYKNCYGEFLNIIKDILIIATPRSEFTKNRGFLKKKSFEYLK